MPVLRSCKQCGRQNRVPADHLADVGRCGACKTSLPPLGEPIEVDTELFNEIIAKARVPVLVDFWASWCGPCKQSFPWMQKMRDTYGQLGLTVIAINLDVDRADADRFLNRFGPTFEVRFDPLGKIAEFYKVQAMPSSLLIDRHGVTRFTHVGFRVIDSPTYEAQVQQLLAEE